MYADDIILITPSPVALQKLVDLAHTFFTANGLVINKVKRTKYMTIKPDFFKDLYVPHVCVEASKTTMVKTKDHLGYIITEVDVADDQPIHKEIRGAYARGNKWNRKFRLCCDEVNRRHFIYYCTNLYCCTL